METAGRKIVGIGETVLDIVFRDGQPQAADAGTGPCRARGGRLERLVPTAMRFSAAVCGSLQNYVPEEFSL